MGKIVKNQKKIENVDNSSNTEEKKEKDICTRLKSKYTGFLDSVLDPDPLGPDPGGQKEPKDIKMQEISCFEVQDVIF